MVSKKLLREGAQENIVPTPNPNPSTFPLLMDEEEADIQVRTGERTGHVLLGLF